MKKLVVILCLILSMCFFASCSSKKEKESDNPTIEPAAPSTAVELDDSLEHMTLEIKEIGDDYFTAVHPWTSPNIYKVYGTLEDTYCVGDYIEVYYETSTETEENTYELTAISIKESDFKLEEGIVYKPVIYLYPTKPTKVTVTLDYSGELLVTEPLYENEWSVMAYPDGNLVDELGTTYPYLFWEGKNEVDYDMSKGFCIAGDETAQFLRDKLSFMGLNEKEVNDFMEFWVPLMKKNPYNLITFQTTDYTNQAKLTISPKPDSILRIFMVFQPLNNYIEIEEQELSTFQRNGFSVIEWGGECKKNLF